jgi:hypothetical protein
MRLSHTKRNKFLECPARYNFHYNLKYRSKDLNSSLLFGNCLDEALNVLLASKMDNPPEYSETAEEIFLKHLERTRHNGEDVIIAEYPHVAFTKADMDSSILTDEDFAKIGKDKTFIDAFIDWYHHALKEKEVISPEDKLLFNKLNLLSLSRKGLMILEAYREQVLPQIHKVYEIQKRVHLPNSKGDSIDGLIDFIASFTDDPSTKYIVDNKTASKAYKQSDLTESDQLHLYAYDQELSHIAYVVCEKDIRKREPRVRITILKGEASEDFTDKLLDTYEDTLYKINEGNFNPNFESGCHFFRKRCEYFDLCHNDKFNDDVLVKLKKEK